MEEVKAVIASPECYQFVPATSEEARGKVERMVNKNPGLRLTPIDGTTPHGMDTRNPYRTFNDGRLFAEVNGSSGVWNFLNRLRHEAAQLATRATNVDALLDHHLGGSNPDAFVEFIRGKVLTWKTGRGPHPNSVKGWLAANGLLNDNAVTEDPWLVDRCERWLQRANTRPDAVKLEPTFTALLGAANVEAVRVAINDAGIVYTAAKGKRKALAALHAACDHWGKHPVRLMDWPPMLTDFFPGSRWSEKNTPRDQSNWDDTYRVAYHAIKDRLSA